MVWFTIQDIQYFLFETLQQTTINQIHPVDNIEIRICVYGEGVMQWVWFTIQDMQYFEMLQQT